MRRRLLLLVALVLPIVGACAGGLVWGLQRFGGGPFESRPWPTSWMGYLGPSWLFSKPLTVGRAQYAWRTNRYVPVRLPKGEAAGPELPIVPGCNYGYVLSEDGRWLGTMTEMDSDGRVELFVYDTVAGSIKHTPASSEGAPNMFQVPVAAPCEARFASDEGRFVDGAKEFKPSLYVIHPGEEGPAIVRKVASVAVPTVPYPANPGGTIPSHVSIGVLARGTDVAWAMLSFGIDGNGGLTRTTDVISLAQDGRIRVAPLSQAVVPGWHPRLNDDGATVELEDTNTWLTYRVRVADGTVLLACDKHRELVLFAANGVTVYVDEKGELKAAMDRETPFATLKLSGGPVWPSGISSDGRWVAAHRFGRQRPTLCPNCVPGVRTDEVLVWDLKEVLPMSAARPAPGPG